jgi:hypothetical protein
MVAVNSLAKNIAGINEQIARAKGNGQPANDLLDQRDQLIRELNQHIQTSQVAADDGTVSVFVAGSQPLVLGNQAATLSIDDPIDFGAGSGKKVLSFLAPGSSTKVELNESMLGGGQVAGLLRFQNNDLNGVHHEQRSLPAEHSQPVRRCRAQHRSAPDIPVQPAGKPDLGQARGAGQRRPGGSRAGRARPHAAVSYPDRAARTGNAAQRHCAGRVRHGRRRGPGSKRARTHCECRQRHPDPQRPGHHCQPAAGPARTAVGGGQPQGHQWRPLAGGPRQRSVTIPRAAEHVARL